MIRAIDHVSIITKDMGKMKSALADAFGFVEVETLEVPQQGFRSTLIRKEAVVIELLEPLDPEGAMAKFLGNREAALHHFSLQVDSIVDDPAFLKTKGLRFISDKPLEATEKARTNFIHPRAMGGILIELIERNE